MRGEGAGLGAFLRAQCGWEGGGVEIFRKSRFCNLVLPTLSKYLAAGMGSEQSLAKSLNSLRA